MALGFETMTLSVPMALALGLAFGAGPCTITCLPYLGPVFAACEVNRRQAWATVLPFSAGRLTGYAALGLLAGGVGEAIQAWLRSPVVGWVLGGATVLVGLSLFWRRKPQTCCSKTASNTVSLNLLTGSSEKNTWSFSIGLFVMGAGMALNPCVPLGTVLLAASATASASAGLSLGLGFGVGAVLLPSLIFVFGIAHFGRQLREHLQAWRPKLGVGAGAMLIMLGISTIMGWIKP
jgi:cytochrome c biogenesis protein CcdA